MIYNKRAAAYSAQGNNPKALQDYDHAVSLDPAAPGARIKRYAAVVEMKS
jgi:Tfp pilus assembly protein PilF